MLVHLPARLRSALVATAAPALDVLSDHEFRELAANILSPEDADIAYSYRRGMGYRVLAHLYDVPRDHAVTGSRARAARWRPRLSRAGGRAPTRRPLVSLEVAARLGAGWCDRQRERRAARRQAARQPDPTASPRREIVRWIVG
jgi:hypothetical protein